MSTTTASPSTSDSTDHRASLTNSTPTPVRLTSATTGPRIYVASLSDHNAGILHGAWIDADQDAEQIRDEIATMMALSPTAKREGWPAEEYAIHDHEGFCGLHIDEWHDLDELATLAGALADHPEPEAVAAYVSNGYDLADFDEAYRGCWASVEEYAADELEGWGVLRANSPEEQFLVRYFDFDAYARDLVLGGDIWTAPASGGEVYIFSGNV